MRLSIPFLLASVAGSAVTATSLRRDLATQDAITGSWKLITSGPEGAYYNVPAGTTTKEGEPATWEQVDSFQNAILTDGYTFLSNNGSQKIPPSQARNSFQAVINYWDSIQNGTVTVTCEGTSPTGRWALWQWTMDEADGIDLDAANFQCTPSHSEAPSCPLAYCADETCSTCAAPFELLSA